MFVLFLSLAMAVVTAGRPAAARPVGDQRWAVCGEWRQVPMPDPSAIGELSDIALVSPTEAWAVGSLGAEMIQEPLVLHWTGLRWERVAFPSGPDSPSYAALRAVAVVSPNEIWAVGSRGSEGQISRPFTARWLGDRWRLVSIGNPALQGWLEDVAAIPGTDHLWAVGQTGAMRGIPLVLQWNGTGWHRYPVSRATAGRSDGLSGVVAFAHSARAVGTSYDANGDPRLLAARFNGSEWRATLGPPGSAEAVDGVRPDRLWAAGGAPSDRPGYTHPGILRWNGANWRWAYKGSAIGRVKDLVNPAPGVVWAVGHRGDSGSGLGTVSPLVLRLSPHGWVRDRSPDVQGWFEAIDGTPRNLWATHMRLVHGGEPTVFDTYHRC